MIRIKEKKDCCGCSACSSVCSKQCISMCEDEEGFLYPKVDTENCVDCGLCEKVCPFLNGEEEKAFEQKAYIVQNKDEIILKESTSGGAFTAIAQYVIEQGGVVFGAAFDGSFDVIHKGIEIKEGLWEFRNSKYVQSDMKETFREVRDLLQQGRQVCFSGTPCQVEGLKSFLRKNYGNLITIDVVCRAVPSPLVYKKYLEMERKKAKGNLLNVHFRDKHYGYDYTVLTVKDSSGKTHILGGVDSNPYLRAFFSNICDRPSCYKCPFKKRYRVSDITLWDCFDPLNFVKKLPDGFKHNSGQSNVLVHTSKGEAVMKSVRDSFIFCKADPEKMVAGTEMMLRSVPIHPERSAFFEDVSQMDGAELFQKWFPVTWKSKLVHSARVVLFKLGLTPLVRKIAGKRVREMREKKRLPKDGV